MEHPRAEPWDLCRRSSAQFPGVAAVLAQVGTLPKGKILKPDDEDYAKATEIADLRRGKCVKLNFSTVDWIAVTLF